MDDRSLTWHVFRAIRALAHTGMNRLDILAALQIHGMHAQDITRIAAMTDADLDALDEQITIGNIPPPFSSLHVNVEFLDFFAKLLQQSLNEQEIAAAVATWYQAHPFPPASHAKNPNEQPPLTPEHHLKFLGLRLAREYARADHLDMLANMGLTDSTLIERVRHASDATLWEVAAIPGAIQIQFDEPTIDTLLDLIAAGAPDAQLQAFMDKRFQMPSPARLH